jgi:ectoine hydroxylase-related dioxygenase (phytanoyl-CoA dioxygenase family)
MKLDPKKYNNLNSETFLLPCTSGELILFPSNLKHSVPINQGDEDRISMSFNTFSIDTLGSENSLTHLDIRRLMNEHN